MRVILIGATGDKLASGHGRNDQIVNMIANLSGVAVGCRYEFEGVRTKIYPLKTGDVEVKENQIISVVPDPVFLEFKELE